MEKLLDLQATAPLVDIKASAGVGQLIRTWRGIRRLTQMELALDAGISPRHLSFVETGRSLPSRHVLLALAERLGMPLRMRNTLLLTAGYAPGFGESGLGADQLIPVRSALRRLLDAHHPYPGLVLDRSWNVMMTNGMADGLMTLLPLSLQTLPVNLFRISLHPEGLAAHTENFEAWGNYLLQELYRLYSACYDEAVGNLIQELLTYPNVRSLATAESGMHFTSPLLVPFVLRHGAATLSFFTTLARIGSPHDVTLDELWIELFYPNNEATRVWLEASRATA